MMLLLSQGAKDSVVVLVVVVLTPLAAAIGIYALIKLPV